MKIEGIVIEYDNYCGKIEGSNNQLYLVLKKDVLEEIKKGDKVIFESERYGLLGKEKNIARFVKLLK